MSELRFGFITTFYPPWNFGGDGIAIQRLAQALARRGHPVTVLHDADAYRALAGTEPEPGPAEPPGVEVVSLRSRLGVLSPLLAQQTGRPVVHGRHLARVLRDRQCNVINFHNVSLVGGPGLFRFGDGVKLYMAHEHWLVCPTHVLWRHRREVCTGRECLRCQLRYRRPPQWWRWTGLLERELHHIDAFIAMSEFSRAKHREFGFPREMEVLPYFLPEADETGPAGEMPVPHPRPYFLFVGRLEAIKGLQDVLPAFEGDGPADLVVAGDGDFAPSLRTQAHANARVRFLGRIPERELATWYRHAVALIVPSRCFETFGIILLEAWRQGTPVLARRLGPFPELVEQAGGGEVFTTIDELRSAMARLVRDPTWRAQLALNGRQAVARYWADTVVVPRYLDLVHGLARQKGPTSVKLELSSGVEA